jgi:uncharacterized oligopeptide transporter (OPT) family protein
MVNEKSGFTIRAAVIAVILSLILLMSTSYVALKLGAAPWPIIFSVIVSGGILKILNRNRRANIHEVNVAQAGASIGGLMAAGIVFTVPGIYYLNQSQNLNISLPNPWLLGGLCAIAGLLGVLLSIPLKYTFIDKERLPYPAGTAGAELLKLGKTGGRQLFLIMAVGALAGIFALLRDVFFPSGYTLNEVITIGIFVTLLPLPLAIGGGYILGARPGISWFVGACLGWLILVPILIHMGSNYHDVKALTQNLGMGIVLGAGISFFFSYFIPRLKEIFIPLFTIGGQWLKMIPWFAAIALMGLIVMQVPVLAAVLSLIGVWIMVAIAARMTGETNIDPLEQFGIFIGLLIAMIYSLLSLELSMFASFIIITFISVSCAIAGDVGHDYKSAKIVGTKFFDIVKVDLIAVIFAGFAAPFVLNLLYSGFSDALFSDIMPAPQAQLVASSIFGFAYPAVFTIGFAIGFLGELSQLILPRRLKNRLLWMPLGIGLFLGMGLAIPIVLGSIIRFMIDRKRSSWYHQGLLIAAGVMGGEGIAGFSAGALTISGLSYQSGAYFLMWLLLLILIISIFYFRRVKD